MVRRRRGKTSLGPGQVRFDVEQGWKLIRAEIEQELRRTVRRPPTAADRLVATRRVVERHPDSYAARWLLDQAETADRENPPPPPAARAARGPKPTVIVTDSRSAELAAQAHMRWLGHEDAEALPIGPDGGVDVGSSRAIAQVKDHGKPIGSPDVQQLFGVATAQQKLSLFYSRSGFTAQAQAFADSVGLPTFRLGADSAWQPTNRFAGDLEDGSSEPPPRSR